MAPVLAMKTRMGLAGDAIEVDEIDVPVDLQWVWRAFWRLADGRSWLGGGMGASVPAPIAFRDVIQWSEYYGHDEDMVHILDHCIRAMDAVYIEHNIQKAKKNDKS